MVESVIEACWYWISWAWMAFWGPSFGVAVAVALGLLMFCVLMSIVCRI